MAKKGKELTLEEKLEQALVPAEEQPYEVPENWCWVRLGMLAEVKGGKRIPKGHQLQEISTPHVYLRVTDFTDGTVDQSALKYIDDETFEIIKNYVISNEDIYISIAGSIGKVGIIPNNLSGSNLTENAAKITRISGIAQEYLYWYLTSEQAQKQMRDFIVSTTQPKLALFRIVAISVSLPPLAEQQRIVDRIESLFDKLDEAKEKIQNVLDESDNRKSVILYKAYWCIYRKMA